MHDRSGIIMVLKHNVSFTLFIALSFAIKLTNL